MVKRLLITLSVSVMSVFLCIPQAKSTPSELIDNVEIVAIKSMEVQGNILYLNMEIENHNDRSLKFEDGRATFYLRTNKGKKEPLSEKEIIGSDEEINFILQPSEKLLKETSQKTNEATFKIDLGKEPPIIINKLTRMINAIGNPQKTNPIFYFDGKCYMGIESDKGWTSARIKFNWVFQPELQEKVFLKASLDLPFPEFMKYKRFPLKVFFAKADDDFEKNPDKNAKDQSYHSLNKFGEYVSSKELSETHFTIEGYASSEGTTEYNQDLSKRRAENIKDYLVKKFKIDPDRISTKGYGESNRKVWNDDTEAKRAKNRRVESVIEIIRTK